MSRLASLGTAVKGWLGIKPKRRHAVPAKNQIRLGDVRYMRPWKIILHLDCIDITRNCDTVQHDTSRPMYHTFVIKLRNMDAERWLWFRSFLNKRVMLSSYHVDPDGKIPKGEYLNAGIMTMTRLDENPDGTTGYLNLEVREPMHAYPIDTSLVEVKKALFF